MKTTIIMPTIRLPRNLDSWVALLNPGTDEIIIAGNAITPHVDVINYLDRLTDQTLIQTTYLHPNDDRLLHYTINEFLPLNHTNRRNLALLHAIDAPMRPDVIVTIDDDNYPRRESWLNGVHALLDDTVPCNRPVLSSESGWWNAGNLCHPRVIHRGYPVSRWTEKAETQVINEPMQDLRIGVVASLWHGDPDINATERMLHDPEITDVTGSVILARGTWCPFDSQSTSVAGPLAEMLFMWPGVDRYDDIWSSYVMRAVMDLTQWYITYGAPTVSQDRNPHNLIKDLREETHGYEFTERFTDKLRELVERCPLNTHELGAYETFRWFMVELATSGSLGHALPGDTRDSLLAWMTDCDRIRDRQLAAGAL